MMPSRSSRVVAMVGLWLLLAAGCAVPPGTSAAQARRPLRGRARACGRAPPAPPAALADVVASAGEQLLREAQAVVGGARASWSSIR
jgi:hypothetical protein